MDTPEALAHRTVEFAQTQGAQESEVLVHEGMQFNTTVRMGKVETLTEATNRSLSLRVIIDKRTALATTSDFAWETVEGVVRRAIERARLAHADPFAGLPEKEEVQADLAQLALYDESVERLSATEKIALAEKTEKIGLALDPRITNSSGADFRSDTSQVWLVNSKGFSGSYRGSMCSLSLALLGQEPGSLAQVQDFWFTVGRRFVVLEAPEKVAQTAVERLRRHFGAKKLPTQDVPVVFDPLMAAELISEIFEAVAGENIYLKSSFLVDQLDKRVASELVTILDDGLMPGGLGSRPFDREGVPTATTTVMENGVLKNYLLSSYSARKLNRKPTGNGGSGTSENANNFYLQAGKSTPEEIIQSVDKGLYLTRMIGQGVNIVTGDYSRGAFGLWIEDGKLAHPAHEITISGNLTQMLADIEMVGNDLVFRDQFAAPTLKIAKMTVGGI